LSPAGTIATARPEFTWEPTPTAAEYRVWVRGSTGVVLDQWVTAPTVCTTTLCSLPAPADLAEDSYVWAVQGRAGEDLGAFSAAKEFAVQLGLWPPRLLSPLAAADATPKFYWKAVDGATQYRLVLASTSALVLDTTYSASEVCTDGTCSVTPSLTLTDGSYTWSVQANDGANASPWAEGATFLVTVPTLVEVDWTFAKGVSLSGNNLTQSQDLGAWKQGAISTRAIASGNGYAEFTVTETNTSRMFGLERGQLGRESPDIDFALAANSDGTLSVYESGVKVVDADTYASGDRLRIAVEDGVVTYLKNGTLLYTSTAMPSYPLFAGASTSTVGATITDAVLSGVLQPLQDVLWTSPVGATISGNSVTRTAAGGGWTASAISAQGLQWGDGYAEFTAQEASTRIFGFTRGALRGQQMDYGVQLGSDGTVTIYERGVQVTSDWTYGAGDRIRVSIEGGFVHYRRNGDLLYASWTLPTYPLFVDAALATQGATIANAVISGSLDLTNVGDLEDDPDHDGLSTDEELRLGTNPFNPDTNGNGIPDGVEVALGLDPTSGAGAPVPGDTTPPVITLFEPGPAIAVPIE
jgi:hypothetical protein